MVHPSMHGQTSRSASGETFPPDPTPAIVQGARSKQLLASNLDRNVERISIPVGSMGFYLLISHKNQLN